MLSPTDVFRTLDLSRQNVIMLVGGSDTGKSTYARELLTLGVERGIVGGYVDADVALTNVAPPACAGLRVVKNTADLETLETADEIRFVGATSAKHLVLQLVVATASLVQRAKERAQLIVIDTSSVISGVVGETLKYHKMELCRPDLVIGLQRGGELELITGMLNRFFSVEIKTGPPHPSVQVPSPVERSERKRLALGRALSASSERWRVRPTVFAPTLPSGFDLARLHHNLVGIQDGSGNCIGLDYLEHDGEQLKAVTSFGEGMQGLRLGNLRVNPVTFDAETVNLREIMFGVL
jgi:polynucleotide 5'-kinase involved in rRNA processing